MSKTNKKNNLEAQIEALAGSVSSPEELESLTRLLQKKTFEAMLNGEMNDHLGYGKHANEGHNSGNNRNGYSESVQNSVSAQPAKCPARYLTDPQNISQVAIKLNSSCGLAWSISLKRSGCPHKAVSINCSHSGTRLWFL